MSRTSALAVVLVLLAAAAGAAAEPVFHLAILGDRTGGHVPGVYPRVIDEINLLGPDIVVTVGDHIEGYGDDFDRVRAEWDSLSPMLSRLNAPLYMTPGNHDIWSDEAEPVYVEKTGREPYYSFDYKGVHFVILDTGRYERAEDMDAAQISWLRADLAANRGASRTFVFFHKPFWEQALPQGKPDLLHGIFVENGVDAVFSGHYHVALTEKFDGIDYVIVGSSGAGMGHSHESVARGEFYQFAWVTVRPEGYEIALVDAGSVLPRGVVTEESLAEAARIENSCVRVSPVRVDEFEAASADVTVGVRNESSREIDDVLSWDVPGGWTVEPSRDLISLAPGASLERTFRADNVGALYPTPTLTFDYPMPGGRDLPVEVRLKAVRTVSATAAAAPPTIDGALSEADWSRAGTVERLYAPYEESVEGATRFLFLRDAENLYVAAVCEEPGIDAIAAAVEERDGPVYGEDCVGLFLQPDRDAKVVYQVYWNPLGTVFDQRISFNESTTYAVDRDWNGEYEAAASRGDGAWTIEVRIPFSTLGASASSSVWGLNFRRKQARTQATADWQVPIDYDPATFGELVLE